jgi:hypothetical protein
MNRSEPPDDDEALQLWQAVPLGDYKRPERPATEAVRSGFSGLFKRNRRTSANGPVVADEHLRQLPSDLLNASAAWPDWAEAVPELEQALSDITRPNAGRHRIRALVGAPYSGAREAVRCWAEQRQWPIIEPPTPARILAQDESWFEALAAEDGPPIIIAELEHCLLRHPFGLAFLRRLFDQLHASPRPCLIATNSWTWAYLTVAMQIGDHMAAPLTLQAFDSNHLERWFRRLVRCDGPVVFRQADDGSLVFATGAASTAADSASAAQSLGKRSDFLGRLAGHSRGIAGVAWGIWRQSLETAASEDVATHLEEADAAAERSVIWVCPWARIHRPTLPADAGLPELLVLHALLIHGGLPDGAVSEVLAALGSLVVAVLRSLAAYGIIEEHQGRWQVTPVGYPAARAALESEGLLVDWL